MMKNEEFKSVENKTPIIMDDKDFPKFPSSRAETIYSDKIISEGHSSYYSNRSTMSSVVKVNNEVRPNILKETRDEAEFEVVPKDTIESTILRGPQR
jgi:hypothetical protein